MTQGNTSPGDISISIDQTEAGKYRIQTAQLEQIGKQLRGKQSFSVFYSIVLPLVVTVLTMLLTGLFQWISWANSVRLQDATETWTKASETHERVASAIGKRRYATLLFIPTIRDLAAPMRSLQVADAATDGSSRPAPPAPAEGTALQRFQHQLLQQRHDTYFALLKAWNESYDQTLTDIEYNLDRQIFLKVERRSLPVREFFGTLAKIDCSHSLPPQLDKLGLDRHSLKIQFASLQHCYMRLNGVLNQMLRDPAKVDTALVEHANKKLSDVFTMGNEFRCYSQRRVDYYRRQKERSLISPDLVWRRLFRTEMERTERHFTNSAARCSPTERRA